jgi:DNA-binding transcriptional LysR family regulator
MVRQRGRRAYDAYQPKRWATMKIQSLRYVITLAEELHFGRAARRHYIVPQAFGREVQRLERELGVRLFDRTSRRVALTTAGERFVIRARQVLAEVDELGRIAAEDPPQNTGVLRVGCSGSGWPTGGRACASCWPRSTPGSS